MTTKSRYAAFFCAAIIFLSWSADPIGWRAVNRVQADGLDRSSRPRADRKLTTDQIHQIVSLSDRLIDKSNDWVRRKAAANQLGEKLAHTQCIPALLAVLRDQKDHSSVRQQCVLSLSWIRDRRVIEFLIEAVLDRNGNVSQQAERQLRKITLLKFQEDLELPPAGTKARRQHHDRWRDWWKDNRKTRIIYWDNALQTM